MEREREWRERAQLEREREWRERKNERERAQLERENENGQKELSQRERLGGRVSSLALW